jgi:hypothetical protein
MGRMAIDHKTTKRQTKLLLAQGAARMPGVSQARSGGTSSTPPMSNTTA